MKKKDVKDTEKVTKVTKTKKEKKPVEKKAKEKKKRFNIFKSIINWFVEEVRELKRVSWPSKRTMVKNFIATFCTVIFLGILFYAIDVILAWLKAVVM